MIVSLSLLLSVEVSRLAAAIDRKQTFELVDSEQGFGINDQRYRRNWISKVIFVYKWPSKK